LNDPFGDDLQLDAMATFLHRTGMVVSAPASADGGAAHGKHQIYKKHSAMGPDHCLMRAKTTKDFVHQAEESKDIHNRGLKLLTSSPWDKFVTGDDYGGENHNPDASAASRASPDVRLRKSHSLPSRLQSTTSLWGEVGNIEVVEPRMKQTLKGGGAGKVLPIDIDTVFNQFSLLAWSSSM
jgi:hypothetical protein